MRVPSPYLACSLPPPPPPRRPLYTAVNNCALGYLITDDNNKRVQGGIGNMSRGGGHLNACPGGVRRHNRSLSRGEGNNIEACPGGWNKTEACPGAFTSLSREGGDII